MRCLLTILCLACGDPPFGSQEPPPDDTLEQSAPAGVDGFAIDLPEAAALFRQARALSDADGGELWGRALYGPMLFVDPATRATVANERPKVKDRRSAFTAVRLEELTLYTGALPGDVSLGNTATEWAGRRWSMVLWPVQADTLWSGTLIMHESFHRLQPELGIPLAVPANHHLDGPQGRLWLRMEWRALAEALRQDQPLESEALQDAFVFRRHRQSLFDDAQAQERALELNEGLAEYTGLRLGGADAAAQKQYALRALDTYDGPGPLVRRFAYASGPPYCMLLDLARPPWKQDVTQHTDVARMLERAVRFPPPRNLAEQALRRAASYGYEDVLAQETAREDTRQAQLKAHRDRYVDNPVLIVEMRGAYNYSFSPYNVHALDGIGTIYGSMQLNGPFGTLDAPGGVLIIEEASGLRRVIIPAPDDPEARPLVGDGWVIELARGWRLARGPRPSDWVVVEGRGR